MLIDDLLVLPFAPQEVFLWVLQFPLLLKNQHLFPNSNSTWNQVEEEPLSGCATSVHVPLNRYFYNIYLFIYKLAQAKHSLLICYWHYIQTTEQLFTSHG